MKKTTEKENSQDTPQQTQLSITELKAHAFDALVEIERIKAIYNNIQSQIAERTKNDPTV